MAFSSKVAPSSTHGGSCRYVGSNSMDTGRPTLRGAYRMADETYVKLLEHLDGPAGSISSELRSDILDFYKDSDGPESEKAKAILTALRSTQ